MKQTSKIITTEWKDLAKTAKDLEVPVSTVIFTMENIKTNNRLLVEKYIQHINEVQNKEIKPIIITTKVKRLFKTKVYRTEVAVINNELKVRESYLNPITGGKENNKANEVTILYLEQYNNKLKHRYKIKGY